MHHAHSATAAAAQAVHAVFRIHIALTTIRLISVLPPLSSSSMCMARRAAVCLRESREGPPPLYRPYKKFTDSTSNPFGNLL